MKRSSSSTGSRHRLQRPEQLAANSATWLCLSPFARIDKLDPASTVITVSYTHLTLPTIYSV